MGVQRKIQAGYGFALIILMIVGVTAIWSARRDAGTFGLAARSAQVEDALQRVRIGVLEIEAGQRGYVLTDDEAFLPQFDAGCAGVRASLHRARELTRGQPEPERGLTALDVAVAKKIAFTTRNIALRRAGDAVAARQRIASGEGRQITEDVRRRIAAVQTAQRGHLASQSAVVEHESRMTIAMVAFVSVVGLMLVGASSILVRRDLEKRQQAQNALRRIETNLRVTLHSIGDAVVTTDTSGRITRLNPVAQTLTGWTQNEASGNPVDEVLRLVDEQTGEPAMIPLAKVLAGAEIRGVTDHVVVARDGTRHPIAHSVAPIRDADGAVLGVVLVFRDVMMEKEPERAVAESERHLRAFSEDLQLQVSRRTADLQQTNRLLRSLSEFNQMLVRAQTEQELFDQVCRTCVEHAGYQMAFVGMRENDDAKSIRITAWAGIEPTFRPSWADDDECMYGPSGVAIRTGLPSVVNDAHDHPGFRLWREAMAQLGVKSAAAFPLIVESETIGAVVIASAKTGVFTPSEVELLTELANDLAYGITALRTRTARERAEADLRGSEERFRLLVDGVRDYAIFMLDPEGCVVTWNSGAEQLIGYRKEEIVGQHFSRFYLPEAVAAGHPAEELLAAARAGRHEEEGWRVRRDGSRYWASVVVSALSDETGRLRGFAKVTHDLTERRRADETLHREQEFTRAVLQSAADGIVACDANGTLILFNEAARTWHGIDALALPPEEWSNHYSLYSFDGQTPLETDNVPLVRAFRGETIHNAGMAIVPKGKPPRFVLASGGPFFDAGGHKLGAVIAMRDVTRHKQSEEALRTSEADLQEAQRLTHVGSWRWDAKTDQTTGSHELFRIYGFDPATDTMPNFRDQRGRCYPVEEWERIHSAVQRTMETGIHYQLDVRAFRNGAPIWITTRGEAVRDAGGTILGLRGTVQDITDRKQAEAALRDSEEKFRIVVETLDEVSWMSDPGMSTMIHVSPAYERVWGRSCQSLYDHPRSFLDAIHSDDRARVLADLQLQQRGEPFDHEYRIVRPDGDVRHIWDRGFPVRDADGKVRRYVGVAQDITTRRQAELALRASEANYRTLAESSRDMIFVVGSDGRLRYLNSAAARALGREVSDLIGVPWPELFPLAFVDLTAPKLRHAFSSGEPLANESKVPFPGGELWLNTWFVPLFDPQRNVTAILAVARDVTAQKKTEQLLQLQSDALQAAANAIVIADRDGAMLWVNSAFTTLTGYSAEQAIGQKTSLLKSGKQDTAFYTHMWNTVLSGKVWRGELVNSRKDGSLYQEAMSITPVRGEGGDITHFIAIKQDITYEKEIERRLQRSQRLESLGTLAGGIAHDLNNALAPIMMSVETVRRRHPDETRALDLMQSSTRRASEMVRQLLTFARGTDGARVTVHVSQLLREMEGIVRTSFPKNIELRIHCDKDLPTIQGDPTQLHQALLNLCVNARDAMPVGGRLSLEAKIRDVDDLYASSQPGARAGRYLRLRVTDTGTGITPDVLDRMFEPFFTTKSPDIGTGLGLSTTLGIVQSHGGFLRVSSEPGRGTIIGVYLPADNGTTDEKTIVPATTQFRGTGQKILFVDDEPAVREAGLTILTARGFTPLPASGGEEALALIAQHGNALAAAIIDIQMPHMNGVALADALRRTQPELPVAAMSGRFDDPTKAQLLELDVTAQLDKPFTEDQLLDVLESLLVTNR